MGLFYSTLHVAKIALKGGCILHIILKYIKFDWNCINFEQFEIFIFLYFEQLTCQSRRRSIVWKFSILINFHYQLSLPCYFYFKLQWFDCKWMYNFHKNLYFIWKFHLKLIQLFLLLYIWQCFKPSWCKMCTLTFLNIT